MNVLVLAGEIGSSRPITYGLSGDWNVRTEDLVSKELLALSEKFEGAHIPHEELSSVVRKACQEASSQIDRFEPAAIVATGFAADIITIMKSRLEWTGPAVLINPIGYCRPVLEHDRRLKQISHVDTAPDCVWIDRKVAAKRLTKFMVEKFPNATVIHHENIDTLYQSGILSGCVSLAVQSRT